MPRNRHRSRPEQPPKPDSTQKKASVWVRIKIYGGSTIDQHECTATAETQHAADRAAHQQALDYLVSSFNSSGKEMDPGTRDAYFESITKETAWLDAAKAGRQTARGCGGHWPDDYTLRAGSMSGEAHHRFANMPRLYAWGYGGSEKEATYYRYHSVAQKLALRIRRETDKKKHTQLQEASQLLADIMQKQFTMVAQEQATWKETQQALQDIVDPEAAWHEAPQVPTSEPLKPAETPETTTT
ncbi:MAG: hypothetical protein Q8O51_01445 [bacterium]|nr:hypothetical protein [bacterium]